MKNIAVRVLAILVIASLLATTDSFADKPDGKPVVSNSTEVEQFLVYPGTVAAPATMPSGEIALAPSQVGGVPVIVAGDESDFLRLFSPGTDGTVIPPSAPQPSGEEAWYFGRPDAASLDWSNTFYAWAEGPGVEEYEIHAAVGNHFTLTLDNGILITNTWGWNGNVPTVRAAAGPGNVVAVCFRHGNGDLVCTWANQLNDLPGRMQTIVDIAGTMGTVNLHAFDVAVDPTSLRPVVTYVVSDQSNEPALLVGLQLNADGTTTSLFNLQIEGSVNDVQSSDVESDFAVAILRDDGSGCTAEIAVIDRTASNQSYYGWKEIGNGSCNSEFAIANAGDQGVLVAYNSDTGGIRYGYTTPKGSVKSRGWVSSYDGDVDPTAMCSANYQGQVVCQVLYNYTTDHSVWRTQLAFPRNGGIGSAAGVAYVDTNSNGVYNLDIDQVLPNQPVCLEHNVTGALLTDTSWINGEYSLTYVPVGTYTAVACPTVANNYLPDPSQWIQVEADMFIDDQHIRYSHSTPHRGTYLPLIIRN